MNKVLAEIIAGVIPHKMTRNRWRGILRYGPIKALKLKLRMKRDHTPPQYYLAVCAIAKNEGRQKRRPLFQGMDRVASGAWGREVLHL